MRIVSGRFKNKLVNTLETKELRPTLSKIRESIFDVLQDKVINSSWLDLFAGSGLVGIEAASRFAKEIVFVEKNPKHFKLLKQNLSNFNFEYKIYLNDALRALKYFNEEQFDIIFLDPPYETGCIEKVLPVIAERNILKTGGYIIVECTKNENFTQITDNIDFENIKEKIYGGTKLIYLKKKITSCDCIK